MLVEEHLIECVKRYPELYDPSHPLYSVMNKKGALWAAIGREVGDSASACKARWNSMRDGYRRSVRRNIYRARKGEEPKFYKYSQSLSFIKNFIKPSKVGDDSDDDVELESVEDDESSQYITPKRKRMTEEREKSPSEVYLEYYPDVESEEVQESPTLENQQHQQQVQGLSTMDSFLACVGATLKSLPPYYASLAKADIFACVQKYELRAITDQEPGSSGGGRGGGGVPHVSASHSLSSSIKLDPLEPQ